MSQERDSHFAGFAKLQADDICFHLRFVIADTETAKIIGAYLQAFLARCDYDLARHVLYHALTGMDRWYISERVNENVPDLTEWPETEKE